MKTMLTIRFWIHSIETAYDISNYRHKFYKYNGDKYPYKIYAGRYIFVLDDISEIKNIIEEFSKYSSLSEMLINDKWVEIK